VWYCTYNARCRDFLVDQAISSLDGGIAIGFRGAGMGTYSALLRAYDAHRVYYPRVIVISHGIVLKIA